MRLLRFACVLFCLTSIGRFLRFGHGVPSTDAVAFGALLGPWARYVYLLNAVIFAVGFIAVQWRVRGAWTFVWVSFVVLLSEFMLAGVLSLYDLPGGKFGALGLVVGCGLMAIFCTYWWRKQRGYFERGNARL